MLCPNCLTENPDNAERCSQCLSVLEPNASSPGNPAQNAPAVNEAPIALPPYRPSGRVTTNGLLMLVAVTIIGPLVLGYAYYKIAAYDSSLTYGKIGMAIAALLGALEGGAMYWVARVGKLRNPALLAVVGTLAGALIFGMRLEYEAYEPGNRAAIAFDTALAGARTGAATSGILSAAPPANPIAALTDYVSWLSDGKIVRTGTGGLRGTPITGFDFWFEFLFPAFGALAGAGAVAYQGAKKPFCEKCSVWMVDKTILKNHPNATPLILDRITAGDWNRVRQMPLAGTVTTKNVCVVSMIRCDQCFDSFVMVKNTVSGKEKQIFYGRSPGRGASVHDGQSVGLNSTEPSPPPDAGGAR